MYLSPSNLAYYLISRGHATFESIVDGDFCVIEVSRRNRNFKVVRRHQPGLFVKQVRSLERNLVESLGREANCYRTVQSRPEYDALARLMPNFIDYDPARHVLLLELLPQSENLTQYHFRLGKFPTEVGELMGRQLGTCHSDIGRQVGTAADTDLFPRQVPWILSLHRQQEPAAGFLSGANSQLVDILRQYPDFQQRIDEVREQWRPDSLIHGDIKFSNCLVVNRDDGGLEFRIIDWELADYGDAAWDVGGVLQAFLHFWIDSMPFHDERHPEQFAAGAGFKIEAMRPAIGEFWRTYVAMRGLTEPEATEQLLRCVRFGAARMIQTAFEYMSGAQRITRSAVTMLQVSLNVLSEPREATRDLFGL